jgi:hypothetical protein
MIDEKCYEGELLANDEIPSTLMPLLQRFANDQLPVLLDTAKHLKRRRVSHADQKLPRILGMHSFTLDGATDTRAVIPYSYWMFRRPLDYYRSLKGAQRKAAEALLEQLGVLNAFAGTPPVRLVGSRNTVWFDDSPPPVK